MDYNLIIKARQALQPLWAKADLKGRCWGPKRKDNPYSATNITLAIGDELVSISQKENRLAIHEFSKTENTRLGGRVRLILQKANLMPKEEVFPVFDYTWFCEVCKKRGGINCDGVDDPRIIAQHIYEAHAESSPNCKAANVQIIDRNMVKQEGLMQLMSFEEAK